MSSSLTGICLVDPWLQDHVGHFLNYASSIYNAARGRGLCFKVLAARECAPGIQHILPLEPTFGAMPTAAPRGITRPIEILKNYKRFSNDLSAIDAGFLNPDWILFVENTYYSQLLAWARWLPHFRPTSAPTLVVMLRQTYLNKLEGRWNRRAAAMRVALRVLEGVSHRYRVRLVTDSELLEKEYHFLTRLPVAVLPIPHTNHFSPVSGTLCQLSSSRPINIVSPGRASLTKGIATLARAIKQLVEQKQWSGLSFTMQDYSAPFRENEVQDYITMLRQLGLPEIRIIEHALEEEAYYRMIAEADIVVLPHLYAHYHANTSGPFVEALAMGKPVIVTQRTWMSAQLAQFGAGLTFRDQDVNHLTCAICSARDDYPRLVEQALARREKWVAYHNPENFVDELLKVAMS